MSERERRERTLRATERAKLPPPKPRTTGRPTTRGRQTEASLNGLAPAVREVEEARVRLGNDLERLNHEVRAQMGLTLEKLAWKAAAAGSAVIAAVATRKILTAVWRSATKHDPPMNPADPQTRWSEALMWTAATGVGAGLARVVATRAATAGWTRATGDTPPGLAAR